MKTNVVFEYAGENMETVHDKVAVTGEITECGFAVMMAATNRDGAFVPATVGLRKVNYAKLVGVEPCEADSVAVCSADVLVGRFVNASGAWDELSSNRQVQSGAVRVGIPFVYGLYNFTPVRNGANKKISWWISREGIGHALYCFTANYTPEIGYQFQHISNYISMFEEQFGTPEGKPKFKKTPVGGRNVAVVRIKVHPDVGPAYIVEVPSDEIGSIDEWAREHLKNVQGLSGPWSIDIMLNEGFSTEHFEKPNEFWLIDMAVAERSAYWEKRPSKLALETVPEPEV